MIGCIMLDCEHGRVESCLLLCVAPLSRRALRSSHRQRTKSGRPSSKLLLPFLHPDLDDDTLAVVSARPATHSITEGGEPRSRHTKHRNVFASSLADHFHSLQRRRVHSNIQPVGVSTRASPLSHLHLPLHSCRSSPKADDQPKTNASRTHSIRVPHQALNSLSWEPLFTLSLARYH